ncbi:ABC-type transport auxiliary lipoprotein family protein [Accumulibacter sp.]|uniref:ABC-type transport auxiliary lipoprotein family protein n=1 Tax=Accumulibacter sp. TaxID=2053492 RepID=UPI002633F918|nr:ABC-type transport auxiliary lipoprotein family protein [Accumulibacter sp.]
MIERSVLLAACLLGACAGGTRYPPPVVYDFGMPAQRLTEGGHWSTLALEIKAPRWFDSPAIEYRLLYDNPLLLHGYAGSRWAGAPAQLLAQRLRQQLALVGGGGQSSVSCLIRFELQEFSQVFDTPQRSRSLLQGQASLLDMAQSRRVDERRFAVEQPADSADARGGVHALVLASDQLGRQLAAWLNDLEKRGRLKGCRSTAVDSQ